VTPIWPFAGAEQGDFVQIGKNQPIVISRRSMPICHLSWCQGYAERVCWSARIPPRPVAKKPLKTLETSARPDKIFGRAERDFAPGRSFI
tara:strand:- start:11331 stop:11600 length:270 start_codon:yes stop_codon:yes gene_type:complete